MKQLSKLLKPRLFFNLSYFSNIKQDSELSNYFYLKSLGSNYDQYVNEIFEMKDKSKYIAASLVSKDITELGSLDNFKEDYPYTSSYARCLNLLKSRSYIEKKQPEYIRQDLAKAFSSIENYIKVYETIFLLNSFSEELKLLIQRIYINPQTTGLKQLMNRNAQDTTTKVKADLIKLIQNYIKITEALTKYPEWKTKFEFEISKQLAFINIQKNFPEVYTLVQQQKIFK